MKSHAKTHAKKKAEKPKNSVAGSSKPSGSSESIPAADKSSLDNDVKSGVKNNVALRAVLIAIIFIFMGLLIGAISYTFYKMHNNNVIQYTILDASVEITQSTVGLNADKDALKFGKVTVGGGGTRFIILNATEEAIVQIYVSGDMAPYLSVERNDFIIEPGQSEKVPISLNAPLDMALGEYTGKVHVLLLRPPKE